MGMQGSVDNPLSKSTCFTDLAECAGAFERALHVMNVLADSGLGLGEVLRDYAEQTSQQMSELMQACARLSQGHADAQTIATLRTAHFIVGSAATVLDMTPAAMLRNRADMVGTREKISREEITRICRAFREDAGLRSIMESEEACNSLLQRELAAHGSAIVPPLAGSIAAEHSAVLS